MNNVNQKHLDFEILISTMFRNDLSFLEKMFPHEHFSNYNILIVNQTNKDNILNTNHKNIRVINSFERGSPVSRNLAIKSATAQICLMADDDIVYQPNLKETILNAYYKNPNADIISFEAINDEGKLYTNYPQQGIHNKKSLKKIFTWVITFKREILIKNTVFFNKHFGVGSTFKGETEYVFLRNAYDKGLKIRHVSKVIVMHPTISSGVLMGSDNAFVAKTALRQRYIGNLSYIWLVKYTLYMWAYRYIKFNQIPQKFKIGLQGISKYKSLKASGEIDKNI